MYKELSSACMYFKWEKRIYSYQNNAPLPHWIGMKNNVDFAYTSSGG